MLSRPVYPVMNYRSGHTPARRRLPLAILAALFLAAQILTTVPALAATNGAACHCCCACCHAEDADTPSPEADNSMNQRCGCSMDTSTPLMPVTSESLAPSGKSESQTSSVLMQPNAMLELASILSTSSVEGRSPPASHSTVPLFVLHASFLI